VSRHDEPVGDLLSRVNDGDEQAWNILVDRFAGLVWSVARSFRLSRAATEDVVQTVWLRLAEHSSRIRDPERLASWLATATRHEALRVIRGHQRLVPHADFSDSSEPTSRSVEDVITDDVELAAVLAAFQRLPAADQQLLRLLCTVPPLDYQTIAELLGRSIGSIGPSRARSLDKLRRLLPAGIDPSLRFPSSRNLPGRSQEVMSARDDQPVDRPEDRSVDQHHERLIDPVDNLLVDLVGRSLRRVDPVPDHVLASARGAFAWRTIDQELADLVFDSATELTGTRDPGAARQLTFRSKGVEIEIMLIDSSERRLVGQLVPAHTTTVRLDSTGHSHEQVSDQYGRFSFDGVATGPVRLSISGTEGTRDVLTDWVLL
jgi:RNA polymerase sigma factor (sigma-70 family)